MSWQRLLTIGLLLFVVCCVDPAAVSGQTLAEVEAAFESPPSEARPWVFWYWMHGRVDPDAITADLEAMQRAGLSGAYLMPIQGPTDPPEFEPLATQLSPRFWRMVRHAAREADRLGLRLGMHLCDGFATAGGPWITPEQSMQRLVWSEQTVTGGGSVRLNLVQPESYEGYYRDVATVALPLPIGYGATTAPSVTTSDDLPNAARLARGDNDDRYRSDEPCWIEYVFDEPFTARSVTVRPDGRNYQAQRLLVESWDGGDWRVLSQLDAPRHGWQDESLPVTHSLPETKSERFRFRWDPAGSEPGAEDLDAAKWAAVLKVRSIVLSESPRLHHYRGKSGAVWRQSPATTEGQLPRELCTPIDRVIDLSDSVDAQGRIAWDAPPGEWLVLRFGHTSTGKRNETAGGGIGLECDKMNAAVVPVQYDHWFGEAKRQITSEIGAEAAARVLTTLHLDSWECGAQNWTHDFLPELEARTDREGLARWLPTMAGYPIESAAASESFLHGVRETIAELVAERFFGSLREIADREGLRFTAECTAPTMPGDGMRHFEYVDSPMGEFWLNSPTHDKPTDMLDAIHAAHVYGKRVVQAEAFTQLRIEWDETPGAVKRLGDRNLALGANRLVMHVWTHNPWLDRAPGQTLGGVGLYFQRDQPWVRYARCWTDYLARCQAVLQAGEPVIDVAITNGDDYPRRALTPDKLLERVPGLLGEAFIEQERERLANRGQPQREAPVGVRASANIPGTAARVDPLRGHKYDTLNDTGERSGYSLVQGTEDEPWTEADLAARGVSRDFEAFESDGAPAEGIAWTHRKGDDWDAYFVSNQQDRTRAITISLRTVGVACELWDPNTGDRTLLEVRDSERTETALELAPSQSVLLVVRSEASSLAESRSSYAVTELGPWRVGFEARVGDNPAAIQLRELHDLAAEPDLAGFVGEAIYETRFQFRKAIELNQRVWLEMTRAHALADVEVNGVRCGSAWTAPWRVEVTRAVRAGDNELVIRTPSVWKNALLADQSRPEEERITWTSAPVRLADRQRAPLGMIGPVHLVLETLEP